MKLCGAGRWVGDGSTAVVACRGVAALSGYATQLLWTALSRED